MDESIRLIHAASNFFTGPVAELMAEMDAQERAERMARRGTIRDEREQSGSLEASVTTLGDAADLLTRAALTLAGYHQHRRGEWRKRRAPKTQGQ